MIDVTCALIVDNNNLILVAQRSATMSLSYKWEFPGGKIEANESAENCLVREIKEELDIDIEIVAGLAHNVHTYPTVVIKLIPFICKHTGGQIHLKEHLSFKWVNSNDLLDLDWAEADIPIVHNYLKYLNAIT